MPGIGAAVTQALGDAARLREGLLELRTYAEGVLGRAAGDGVEAALGQDPIPRDAKVGEYVRGDAVADDQLEQDVFGADRPVAPSTGLIAGVVEHAPRGGAPAPRTRAHGRRRLAVALLSGLPARAEEIADLGPGDSRAPCFAHERLTSASPVSASCRLSDAAVNPDIVFCRNGERHRRRAVRPRRPADA